MYLNTNIRLTRFRIKNKNILTTTINTNKATNTIDVLAKEKITDNKDKKIAYFNFLLFTALIRSKMIMGINAQNSIKLYKNRFHTLTMDKGLNQYNKTERRINR